MLSMKKAVPSPGVSLSCLFQLRPEAKLHKDKLCIDRRTYPLCRCIHLAEIAQQKFNTVVPQAIHDSSPSGPRHNLPQLHGRGPSSSGPRRSQFIDVPGFKSM